MFHMEWYIGASSIKGRMCFIMHLTFVDDLQAWARKQIILHVGSVIVSVNYI